MYGHLFSTELLDGFSQDFIEDEFHVPIDTFDDPDYRNALMKVPHGGVCIGAIKPHCVSHRGERYGKLTVLYDHLREGASKSRKGVRYPVDVVRHTSMTVFAEHSLLRKEGRN